MAPWRSSGSIPGPGRFCTPGASSALDAPGVQNLPGPGIEPLDRQGAMRRTQVDVDAALNPHRSHPQKPSHEPYVDSIAHSRQVDEIGRAGVGEAVAHGCKL